MTALTDSTLETLAKQVASNENYAGRLISHLPPREAKLVLIRAGQITEAGKREASG